MSEEFVHVFRCPGCGARLGMHDGDARVFVGWLILRDTSRWTCPGCKFAGTWRPPRRPPPARPPAADTPGH